MTTEYDTTAYLHFTFKHKTEKPNISENADIIRQSIINKIYDMTDDEIATQIKYDETIAEDI